MVSLNPPTILLSGVQLITNPYSPLTNINPHLDESNNVSHPLPLYPLWLLGTSNTLVPNE